MLGGNLPVTVVDHPLAGHFLAELRDGRTTTERFRRAAHRLGALLVAEAVRDLPTAPAEVETPVAPAAVRRLEQGGVVAVAVLRAGLALLPAVEALLPGARVGLVGLQRDETTRAPQEYYRRVPVLAGQAAFVLEPMLATGGSASAAVAAAVEAGAGAVTVVSVVAAPEGLRRLVADHPGVRVVVAAVDDGLNQAAFVVPGLGDFGDRYFGG